MNIRDLLTYLIMTPITVGIVGGMIGLAIIGATGIAGLVIGLGEWISS